MAKMAVFPEHLYPHMVQDYYVEQVREATRKRAEMLAGIKTKKQVLELQKTVRRKLRKCFGKFPKRTPLNARCTGKLERKNYTVENIIYESRPGLPVTASLYIPKGEGPFPAVLGACGHSPDGRFCDLYQTFAQVLARKGFAVFIYDPLSQGERLQFIS